MSRLNEVCQQYLAHSFRPYLYKNTERFPWHNYLKIVYNDALTFDPATKRGGNKAGYKFRTLARAPQNKHLQHLVNELAYAKQFEEDIVIDKLSLSDYFTSAAFFVIREAEGPNILDDISYGRVDAKSEAEAGSASLIPSAFDGKYTSTLKSKGFENDEVVALAAIEAFGCAWDPKKKDTSKYPKLDNYYFKQLLNPSSDVVLQAELTGDAELKAIVEKFAQDEKAYHATFGKAFIKLSNLGSNEEELINVENLLIDHPYYKFITQYY
ncbi:hypothetical protein FGO68_gene12209 [Halteria grandinella]|uniref:Plant heme peroxidase family profile domain-containing protein n=1 Tax=Halteria grandinella TaxID=5974 RepID=A0A8J8SZ78_HALGN|nr:hypothetical protein FGO68_gene12209 [Halteria grandinella]